MTHDTYEGDHRNRPVGADRRSNQTCLLVLLIASNQIGGTESGDMWCATSVIDTWEGTYS